MPAQAAVALAGLVYVCVRIAYASYARGMTCALSAALQLKRVRGPHSSPCLPPYRPHTAFACLVLALPVVLACSVFSTLTAVLERISSFLDLTRILQALRLYLLCLSARCWVS